MEYEIPSDPAREKVFNDHAYNLGLLCIVWSMLDNVLVSFLKTLLQSDDQTAAALSACDTSSRCEILRRLAHVKLPDGTWRNRLLSLVSQVQGELAEKRNRYVHDEWRMSEDGVMIRVDRRPKLKRPQSHQPITLMIDEREAVPVEKIEALIGQISKTMMELTAMNYVLLRQTLEGLPLEQLPLSLPLNMQIPQEPPNQANPAKQKHPRGSSPAKR